MLVLTFITIVNVHAQVAPVGERDIMPSYPGGENVLMKFLAENIIYPEYEKENGIVGTVFVTFVIDTFGVISDAKVLRGSRIGPGLNKEALRVVNTMPAWNPARQGGRAVKIQFNLPIKFILKNVKTVDENDYIKKGNDHYNIGVKKSEENKYEEAIAEFSKTLKYLPEDVDAFYNRGIMYYKLNKKDLACNDWKKIKDMGFSSADELLKKYCN